MTKREKKGPEYLVGIGASAGGLEALERFFKAVEPNRGVAYIVVQHLSPDFKSMMDEILGRLTSLSIKTVEDNLFVEADTIYLNVPRADLTVKDGRIRLTPIHLDEKLNKPVDVVFASLAEEMGDKAIGVILSGTGTDGQIGVDAIGRNGGLVLTQDLNSALFGAMPQGAKESALTSLQLTPEEMPGIIYDYIIDPKRIDFLSSKTQDIKAGLLTEETALSYLLSLLQKKYETDFTHYKPQTIVRRLERRMTLDNVSNLVEYIHLAENDDRLLDVLYREMLIDVTQFFRDKEAFLWLETHVIPRIVQEKEEGASIRVWSAACSSGEESYSIAMLFLEEIERQRKNVDLKMFASDIHGDSISFASYGRYPAERLNETPRHLRQKYFTTDGEFVKVRKSLRQHVVFSAHDLLGDPYFSNQDLIICRNMLIYIRPDSQVTIQQNFTNALKNNGILFLGPSEHLVNQVSVNYETLSRHWRLFQKVNDTRRVPYQNTRNPYNIHLPNHLHEKTVVPSAYQGWEQSLIKALVPSGFVSDQLGELKEIYGNGKEYLNFSVGKVNLNLTELLPENLAIALRNGLMQSQREKRQTKVSNIQVKTGGVTQLIDMHIIPFTGEIDNRDEGDKQFYLIRLDEVQSLNSAPSSRSENVSPEQFTEIFSLKSELSFMRESLQTSLEEIETSNEELQSSNEELTAANEELQSTNEELSSVNEELHTVNAEYQEQNRVLNRMFNDRENLERASNVLTIFLNEMLSIRELTPACYSTFDLIEGDIGRSINQFPAMIGLKVAELEHLTHAALEGDHSQIEVVTHKGVPMMMSVFPYRGERDEITGVLMTFVDLTEIREMEKANRQLNDINNTLPVWISHIDQELNFLYANQYYRQTFYPNLDFIGKSVKEMLGETLFANNSPYYERALAGEIVEFFGYPLINGEKRIAKLNLVPSIEDGEQNGFFVFGIDVTELEQGRLETEQKLDLSEARYQSIVENQSDLIDRFRPDDFVVTFSNSALDEFWGKSIVGESLFDLLEPEHVETLKSRIDEMSESKSSITIERQEQLKDGTIRTVLWTDTPIFNDEGKVVEIQGVGRDISAIRQAEAKLKETNLYLQAINDHLPFWTAIIDGELQVEFLNKYYEILGIDVEASFGKYFEKVIGKEIFARGKPFYDRALAGETVQYFNISAGEKEDLHAFTTLVPRITNGVVDAFYVIAVNVSAQKKAQKEIIIAHDMLQKLNKGLPAWISIVNRDYEYEYVNDFYMESIGRKAEEFIGHHIKDALSDAFFDRGKPAYDKALAGERVDYLNRAKFGDEDADIVISLIPREGPQGAIDSFYILATKKIF